jgi:hypothetical protein
MLLSDLKQRLHRAFATRAGRVALALLIGALLASSLPDLRWHSHVDGEIAHVHPVHLDSTGHHEDPHESHHEAGSEAGPGSLHLHDGNHCSAAPMAFESPCVGQLAHRDRALRADALTLASAAPIPPYRPPIV